MSLNCSWPWWLLPETNKFEFGMIYLQIEIHSHWHRRTRIQIQAHLSCDDTAGLLPQNHHDKQKSSLRSMQALGSSGLVPVSSCAHYFQGPAMQANKNRDCSHKIRQGTQESTGIPKIGVLIAWGLAAIKPPYGRQNQTTGTHSLGKRVQWNLHNMLTNLCDASSRWDCIFIYIFPTTRAQQNWTWPQIDRVWHEFHSRTAV